jgi:hypothetical protein
MAASDIALTTICCVSILLQEFSVIVRVARAHRKGGLEEEENVLTWSQGLVQSLARAAYFSFPGRRAPFVQRLVSVAVLVPGTYAGLSAIQFGATSSRGCPTEVRPPTRRRVSGASGTRGLPPPTADLVASPMMLIIAAGIIIPQILSLFGSHAVVGSYYVLAIAITRLTFLSGLVAPYRSLRSGDLAAAKASEAAIDGCFLSTVLVCNLSWGLWSVYLQDDYLFAVSALSVVSTLPALLLKLKLRLRLNAANQGKKQGPEEGGTIAPRKSLSRKFRRVVAHDEGHHAAAATLDVVLHPSSPKWLMQQLPPPPTERKEDAAEYKQDEEGEDAEEAKSESHHVPVPLSPPVTPPPLPAVPPPTAVVITTDVLRLLQPELTTVDGDSLKDMSEAQARARSELEKVTQPLPVGFFDDPTADEMTAAAAAASREGEENQEEETETGGSVLEVEPASPGGISGIA